MQAAKFSLEGSVGVAQVEQLHASVHEAVQSEQAVELDLSEVRDIDGSILQLILATEAATSERGLEFALTGLSDSLKQLLTFNGAETVLNSARDVSLAQDEAASEEAASEQAPEVTDEEPTSTPTATDVDSEGGTAEGEDHSDEAIEEIQA